MRLLLDTCVVLAMLLERAPWDLDALSIWEAGIEGQVECCISATTVTDIYYIARRVAGSEAARDFVARCIEESTILTVNSETLRIAFELGIADFEDSVQAACTQQNGLDFIVTRDIGFADLSTPVIDPAGLLALLRSEDSAEAGPA